MADNAELRMLVTVKADRDALDGDRFRVVARPVLFSVENGKEQVSDHFPWDSKHAHLQDLEVSAFGNLSDEEPPIGEQVYFASAFRIDAMDAAQMLQTLRKIHKSMEATTRRVGPPESFGAYIVRVGLALGVTQFGFTHPRGEEMWANGQKYRWEDAGGLPGVVSSRIAQLRQEYARLHQDAA